MDEVDGMGGSDRGGIPELIKVIKTSSTPIICVCNDRYLLFIILFSFFFFFCFRFICSFLRT